MLHGFFDEGGIVSVDELSWFRCCPADDVRKAGIKDVFVLCERGELNKYRVPTLLHDMETSGLNVHHYPFRDGEVPSVEALLPVLQKISSNLTHGTKTLVQ